MPTEDRSGRPASRAGRRTGDADRSEPVVRPRLDVDLESCVELLERVRATDGYPVRWPDDPAAWLQPMNEVAAWVAVADGQVVGHAVLRGAAGTSGAAPLSSATGVPVDQICLLARLYVDPSARRRGIAAGLVRAAEAAAVERRLTLGLDVVGKDLAAIALYERLGWRRVATISWVPSPQRVDERSAGEERSATSGSGAPSVTGGPESFEEQPLHCYLAPAARAEHPSKP